MSEAGRTPQEARKVSPRSEADTWGMGDDWVDGQIQLPPLFTEEEMEAMGLKVLAEHCVNLQRACVQLDGENKVLTWELKEANDYLLRFAHVAQIAHHLNASDLDNVSDLAINELPQYLNCRFAAFYLYDQDRSEFTLHHSTVPLPDAQVLPFAREKGHFLANLFFKRDAPYLIEYIQGGYKIDSNSEYLTMIKSPEQWYTLLGDTAMVFPLITKPAEGAPLMLGGLIVGNPTERLTEKDAEVSLMFVDLLSSSLHNAKLVRQLNRMATTDVLTGLYNRRHFLTEMEKAIAHTMRNSQPLAMIMLDIDHFKKFNDAYGHLCGDMVLKEMAALLEDSVRKNVDIPARYGGEEFVVIMPYTRLDQAKNMSERIRLAVEEKIFEFEGEQLHVTCSIGIADFVPGESMNIFIDRADAALYIAKKKGWNQVAAAPSSGAPEEG